jgi:hypothetical protein
MSGYNASVLAKWTLVHLGALGDLALTLQLLLRLPSGAGAAPLRIISRTNPGDLSACQPRITRRSMDGLGWQWVFADCADAPPDGLRAAIAGQAVLSALGGPHTIMHQRLLELGASAVYGFDPPPRPGVNRHITAQWLTQLEAQGLLVPKCIHQRPAHRGLGVPAAVRARGRDLAGAHRYILLHPGSGGRAKCWPQEQYSLLAGLLARRRTYAVRVLLGPVELDTWPAALVASVRAAGGVLTPSSDELVALLAGAALLIGNDAGPGHLAALLGTPTLTLFGPASSDIWRPLGAGARVLQGARTGEPAWGITVADVLAAASDALEVASLAPSSAGALAR